MGLRLRAGFVVAAALALTGCAGVPTAVTFAGMYVNSILMLRTNKSMTDHAVSAALDQDCGFMNIVDHGTYCTDAPAPALLAALSADADMLAPAAAPVAKPSPDVQPVAPENATRTVLSAPPPPPVTVVPAGKAPAGEKDRFLVVLASYRSADTAAAHLARLKRTDSMIIPIDIKGEAYHRVALQAGSQAAARRMLSEAKAAGASGAWVTAGGASVARQAPAAPAQPRPLPAAPVYAVAPIASPLL
jgi:hypothetical protein